MTRWICFGVFLATGCGDPPPPTRQACEAVLADVVDAARTGVQLSDFERELVLPMLDDLRAGVRPYAEDAVGVCEGQARECERYLGLDPGLLPEGAYMLRGEFRVPRVGDRGTWKAVVETTCERTRQTASGEQTSSNTSTREFDMVYAGEDRGYRLSPILKIDSPGKLGAESCTYTITAPHPDGDKVIMGGWAVPPPPEAE